MADGDSGGDCGWTVFLDVSAPQLSAAQIAPLNRSVAERHEPAIVSLPGVLLATFFVLAVNAKAAADQATQLLQLASGLLHVTLQTVWIDVQPG